VYTLTVTKAIWVDGFDVYDVPSPLAMRNVPDILTGEPTRRWVSDEMVSAISDPNNLLHGVKKYGSGYEAQGEGHQWLLRLSLPVDPSDPCTWIVQSFEDRFGPGPSQADNIDLQRTFIESDCLGPVESHVDDIWTPPESTWGGPPDHPVMNFYDDPTSGLSWTPA